MSTGPPRIMLPSLSPLLPLGQCTSTKHFNLYWMHEESLKDAVAHAWHLNSHRPNANDTDILVSKLLTSQFILSDWSKRWKPRAS